MPSRQRPVRRRQSSPTARLGRFWIAFIVVLLLVGGGAFAVASWPGFDPKSVTVEGNRVTSTAAIVERAAIDGHQNIWLANTAAIVARVETLPYVKSARVHRGIPSTVTIDVTERVPYAILQTPSGRALVDADLHVLADQPANVGVPVLIIGTAIDLTPGSAITDKDALALGAAEGEILASHTAVKSLAEDRYDELVVTLVGGVRVLLGDDTEFNRKLALIQPILTQVQKKERAISTLDLRAPNTPVVVYR